MKKRIFLLFAFFVFAAATQAHAAAPEVSVTLDGEPIEFADQAPAIIGGRTLVPIRAVFEHIGFSVEWNAPADATQTVTLTRGYDVVIIAVGSTQFTTNGVAHALDVPAQVVGGRTMLPIRAVLNSVGYYVAWNRATSTVVILSEPPEFPFYWQEEPPEAPPEEPPPPPEEPGPAAPRIPNRRLTAEEIAEWIAAYLELGGIHRFEYEVVRLVNEERAAAGVSPLAPSETLMMAARFKAQSMYDLEYFSHTSPVYGRFDVIAREVFGIGFRAMGENLGLGQRTPEAVVAGWMASDGHRRNILNAGYSSIGVGFYNNRWVQKFTN